MTWLTSLLNVAHEPPPCCSSAIIHSNDRTADQTDKPPFKELASRQNNKQTNKLAERRTDKPQPTPLGHPDPACYTLWKLHPLLHSDRRPPSHLRVPPIHLPARPSDVPPDPPVFLPVPPQHVVCAPPRLLLSSFFTTFRFCINYVRIT